MKTIRFIWVLLLITATTQLHAQQSYGEIRGTLKNELKEIVPFATIKVLQGGNLVGGTQSDAEGNYHYKPLIPGLYDVLAMEAGHKSKQINGVKVIPNEATYLNIRMMSNTFATVEVIASIEKEDYTQSGCNTSMYSMVSIDATDLLNNSAYDRQNIMSAVTSAMSDVIESPDGGYHFRGGRSDANAVFVDGVKTLDMGSMPSLSIENITVFSGGVPAMYGDVTSGVVIVTSKSYFSGIREKNLRNRRAYERRLEKQEREKAELEEKDGVNYQ